MLAGSMVIGSGVSANACCGLYVGSQQSENGSTYVGRSEDIGKLYDKVFEVRPAADPWPEPMTRGRPIRVGLFCYFLAVSKAGLVK